MSDDKKQDKHVILTGIKHEGNHNTPTRMGVFNPNFKPACGHDHSDGSTCGGHHNHDHDHDHHQHHDHHHGEEKPPSEYNNSLLARAFKGPPEVGEVLNNARSTMCLLGAGSLAAINTSSTEGMAGVAIASLIVANWSVDELSEAVQYVRDKLHVGGAAVGIVLSGVHVASEGAMAVMARVSEDFVRASDYVVQVTMSNNLMHATAMTSVVGLAGALSLDDPKHRKMNIAAMTISSAALGLQYVTDTNSLILSAIGAGTAVGYGAWRLRAGLGCTKHGDLCGHSHSGPKDETDYISFEYAEKLGNKIKSMKVGETLNTLGDSARIAKDKLVNFTPPAPQQIYTTMQTAAPTVISFGAIVVAAHAMTDNAVSIGEAGGLSPAVLGTITAGGLVLPELLVAMKNKDMAAAMVMGCTVFGTGFIGGVHGALGNISGNTLTDGWNGAVQMSGLLAPIGIYAAATKESWAKELAHMENKAADWIDRQNLPEKVRGVSKWLRQSEDAIQHGKIRFSKTASALMAASVLAFSAMIANLDDEQDAQPSHQHPTAAIEQDNEIPVIDYEPERLEM